MWSRAGMGREVDQENKVAVLSSRQSYTQMAWTSIPDTEISHVHESLPLFPQSQGFLLPSFVFFRGSSQPSASEKMAVRGRLLKETRNLRDKLPCLLHPQPCLSAGDNMDVCKKVAEPITLPRDCCFSFKWGMGERYSQIIYNNVQCLSPEWGFR